MIEQIVCLVNQANRDIGDDGWGAGLDEFPERFKCHSWLVVQPTDEACFSGVLVPERQVSRTKEVFIIIEQFLQAGPGDIGELDFRLLRGAGGSVFLSGRPGSSDRRCGRLWKGIVGKIGK